MNEIPSMEERILAFWEEEQIFQKSLEQRSSAPEFVFYDGPPFATGLPHYGHIVASCLKDVVPRFKTMQGYYVPRRWGSAYFPNRSQLHNIRYRIPRNDICQHCFQPSCPLRRAGQCVGHRKPLAG